MAADTTMEYSIPAKREVLPERKTYYGWIVKAKEVGWFFSTDDKWATDTKAIRTEKTRRSGAIVPMIAILVLLASCGRQDPHVAPPIQVQHMDAPACSEDSFSAGAFVLELHIQKVQCPDVVLRQACLESDFFRSTLWRTKNNPFGFVGKDGYMMFNDWRSAVAYMKEWQDRRYKGGDYYRFLEQVGYARDCCYVEELKSIDLENLRDLK